MPRRLTRRERLERQKEREEAQASGVPVRDDAPAAKQADVESGISYLGALGGLLGVGLFLTLAVRIIVDPAGDSRLWGIPFGAAAVFFLPAVLASLTPGYPRREQVLRWATFGAIFIALAGSIAVGSLALAVLLSPTTAMLAIAAKLVFQGSGAKK